jgi:hypothetical protein
MKIPFKEGRSRACSTAPGPLRDCVAIPKYCHSGRAQRLGARPVVRQAHHPERSRSGIQVTVGKTIHSGSRLASRSAGFGRDDELQHCLSRGVDFWERDRGIWSRSISRWIFLLREMGDGTN